MIPDLEIRKLTEKLRHSDETLWRRIRQLLSEKSINPQQSVLAYFTTEEPFYEFGVIVTDGREVYEFAFDHLQKDIAQGVFAEWSNITHRRESTPYKEQIALALRLKEKMNSG